jgi:hypothetical protein
VTNNAEMIERERRDGRLRQSDFFVSWEGYFNGLTPIEYAESLTNADRALHAMRATRI